MGSYLAVAEASAADNPPKFIHVTYTPPAAGTARAGEGGEEKALKKSALIGKGHTFHLPALIRKGHTFHLPALIRKGHTFHSYAWVFACPLMALPIHPSHPLSTLIYSSSRLIEYLFYSPIPIPPLSQWRLQLTTSSRPGSMIHPMKFDPGDTAALPVKAVSTRS
ncbi:unnamed protein product [Closterium sp. NIES-65]|nr:unnamed protein product [Closterium sp. NIES-65]